jgi:AP endonuclease-1
MARNIAEDSGSSLSPAPEDLKTPAEAEEGAKTGTNDRKRKAETTVKTAVKASKRTKRGAADEVKLEEEVTVEAVDTPRKKRATAKKVKYEEEDDNANGETAIVEKTVKKKITRTKKSKEPEPPLEERTVDTKLRIGAHVSVAGG